MVSGSGLLYQEDKLIMIWGEHARQRQRGQLSRLRGMGTYLLLAGRLFFGWGQAGVLLEHRNSIVHFVELSHDFAGAFPACFCGSRFVEMSQRLVERMGLEGGVGGSFLGGHTQYTNHTQCATPRDLD